MFLHFRFPIHRASRHSVWMTPVPLTWQDPSWAGGGCRRHHRQSAAIASENDSSEGRWKWTTRLHMHPNKKTKKNKKNCRNRHFSKRTNWSRFLFPLFLEPNNYVIFHTPSSQPRSLSVNTGGLSSKTPICSNLKLRRIHRGTPHYKGKPATSLTKK